MQIDEQRETGCAVVRRLDYVDCLRALACMAVIGQHTIIFLPAPNRSGAVYRALYAIADRGWLGVHLFLMLSGFCLYTGMVKRAPISALKVDAKSFALRRCRRILPPYYLSLFLFSAGMVVVDFKHHWPFGAGFAGRMDIPLHLLMLHNLSPNTIQSINPPFWSLALEAQLYLLFPFFVWIAARRGLATLAIGSFAIAVLYQLGVMQIIGKTPDDHLFYASYFALPGRCFEFALGMVAAALVSRPVRGQERAAALIMALLIVPAWMATQDRSTFVLFRDQMWGAIFASLAVLCAGLPERWFTAPPLRLLTAIGVVSYSVYLYHQPIMQYLMPERLHLHPTSEAALILYAIARGAILITIGAVMYHVWEKRWTKPTHAPST